MLDSQKKSQIIDMCVRGYSRTSIAKHFHMKNKTLEKVCLENNIPLNPKRYRSFSNKNIEGIYLIKGKPVYFRNLNELYFLMSCEYDPCIISISNYDNKFKIKRNIHEMNEIVISEVDTFSKINNEAIIKAVIEQKIKFTSSYLNKKFGVNYEIGRN